jgi:hypothetical protein
LPEVWDSDSAPNFARHIASAARIILEIEFSFLRLGEVETCYVVG